MGHSWTVSSQSRPEGQSALVWQGTPQKFCWPSLMGARHWSPGWRQLTQSWQYSPWLATQLPFWQTSR